LKILIVDDQVSNRMIAKYFVESEGHISIEAGNGLEAIDVFRESRPDLVLMDILMPVMDGYEAASAIKLLVGEVYVPIIFLTAKHDEQSLQKCLECGGDDYLIKPINGNLLKAKIKAHARTQELTQQVKIKNDELSQIYATLAREHEMGMHVLSHTLARNLKNCPNIRHYMSSKSTFNGDILLQAENPQGGIYVFLGDFTGHGLAAAIGTIPLSQLFFSMCEKGEALSDIVRAMNQSLKTFLPEHMFCAATFIHLFERGDSAHIWSGGLPEAYIVRRREGIIDSIRSNYLPLGILDDQAFISEARFYRFEHGDRLVLFSDGMLEGRSQDSSEMYGEHRLKKVLNSDKDDVFKALIEDFHQFTGDHEQGDDLSLIELTAKPYETQFIRALYCDTGKRVNFMPWSLKVDFTPTLIRTNEALNKFFALLPSAMRISYRFDVLQTIVSELYANALEHGLLKLDSSIKTTHEGFAEYYRQREAALTELQTGWIKIELKAYKENAAIKILITVEDSGAGFCFEDMLEISQKSFADSVYRPWGRGIDLVRSFCEDMCYSREGSRVDAVFVLS
jgi:CheY-like chemotaxis protein/anti-sigma regulatory factor (Ser/Thr protein kinase)